MVRSKGWGFVVGLFMLSVAGASTEVPPDVLPAVVAEVQEEVLAPDGHQVSVTSFTVVLVDTRVRVEYRGAPGRSGYAEYQIYDFGRKRLYRVFPADRIYFEGALSAPLASKAFVEGWAPQPADLIVRTIPLKDDDLSGAPARLALVERRRGRGRAPAYALVWTSVPPTRLPLRVIYTQDDGHTVVLAYHRVESRVVDAASVAVPDEFVNLSPF